jgi:hypothetical protein
MDYNTLYFNYLDMGKTQQTGKNGHEAQKETLFFQPNS